MAATQLAVRPGTVQVSNFTDNDGRQTLRGRRNVGQEGAAAYVSVAAMLLAVRQAESGRERCR